MVQDLLVHNPLDPRPGPPSAKKVGGGLSLESHLITFPNTRVGDTTVSKVILIILHRIDRRDCSRD